MEMTDREKEDYKWALRTNSKTGTAACARTLVKYIERTAAHPLREFRRTAKQAAPPVQSEGDNTTNAVEGCTCGIVSLTASIARIVADIKAKGEGMDSYEVKKIIGKETAQAFGIRMARACNEIRSSHVFFIIQQAYPELNGWLGWEDCEELLNRILSDAAPPAQVEGDGVDCGHVFKYPDCPNCKGGADSRKAKGEGMSFEKWWDEHKEWFRQCLNKYCCKVLWDEKEAALAAKDAELAELRKECERLCKDQAYVTSLYNNLREKVRLWWEVIDSNYDERAEDVPQEVLDAEAALRAAVPDAVKGAKL